MFLKKLFSYGRQEQKVVNRINDHIKLLCVTCETFKSGFEKNDRSLLQKVIDLEREGDFIRREIVSEIYEGAFLPYLRPNLCKFVEIVDRVFDLLEDTAYNCIDMEIPEELKGECTQVAFLNIRISEMLLITFNAMLNGDPLREKTLAIRIYEKKIDDIKLGLKKDLHKIRINNFWDGKILSEFISGLTMISDIIEDAGDYLQIISVSMK